MDEQICEYLALKNKIKGWFIYGLGREDDEDLDNMVDQIAFMAIGRTQPDASMTVQSLSKRALVSGRGKSLGPHLSAGGWQTCLPS
jgi:hypothetical protein